MMTICVEVEVVSHNQGSCEDPHIIFKIYCRSIIIFPIYILYHFEGSIVEGTSITKEYNGEHGRCMPPKQGRPVMQ